MFLKVHTHTQMYTHTHTHIDVGVFYHGKIRVNSEKHLFIPAPSGPWGHTLTGTMTGLTPSIETHTHLDVYVEPSSHTLRPV